MSEISSENSEMPDVAFAQGVMRGLVAERPGDNLKHRMSSVANMLGWSPARVKAVFYGEARAIRAKEMDQLRRTAKAERRVEELSHERDELSTRLDRMEAMLAALLASVEGRDPSEESPLVRAASSLVGSGTAIRNT